MPHTTMDWQPVGTYVMPRPAPPNHLTRWTQEQEDELLRLFAAGYDPDVLGGRFGRTTGAINARLAQLLGIQYPDTPVQYRRRGEPIARRSERRRRSTLNAGRNLSSYDHEMALNGWRYEVFPAFIPQPTGPVAGDATVHEAAVETPAHLAPQLQLHRAQYQKMAETIKSARPTGEGRIAVAKNSALNQVAYRMAALFEGEGSTFDRAKWLEACGVTGEDHAP